MKMTVSSNRELSIMKLCKQILKKYVIGTLQKKFKYRVKAALDILSRSFEF